MRLRHITEDPSDDHPTHHILDDDDYYSGGQRSRATLDVNRPDTIPDFWDRLKEIECGEMLEASRFEELIPFIYAPGTTRVLYVGSHNEFHARIKARAQGADKDKIESVYYGEDEGAVGRIGTDLKDLVNPLTGDPEACAPNHLQYVAFYRSATPETIAAAVKMLMDQRCVRPDAWIKTRDGDLAPAKDVAATGQVAQAVDYVASGRPGWDQTMRAAGLAAPGQRWWAPTSESRR